VVAEIVITCVCRAVSTYEGAAFQPAWTSGAVPAAASSSQGGVTSQFYSSNRVLGNDDFYVQAILSNGASSW
jgi:hypothetical protein